MNKNKAAALLLSSALLLAVALPVLPSLLNSSDFYGIAIDEAGLPLIGYQPPSDGLAIVFFGYRTCQTVCPVQMVNLIELSRRLKGNRVDFLFVTLDPENDTDEALEQMIKGLGDAFSFYRPDNYQAAQKLASSFDDFAVKQSRKPENPIAHSARFHVMTSDYRRRLVYPTPDLNLKLVEQDLRRLLREMNSEKSS